MFSELQKQFGNRYKVLRKLGQGGMGSVYLAETNDRLSQKRAIKEIEFDKTVGKDVLHEAFILKELEHDGIPRIIEIKECTDIGKLYLVQEYVEGVTLDSLLKQKIKLKDTLIYEWAKQLVETLLYIHQKGVLHRDIKPENIMITKEGKVKLIDFGIASNHTGLQRRAYTKEYAAPEQFTNQGVNRSSDIFSFGMVLCHLLTGELPQLDARGVQFAYLPDLNPEKYYPGLTVIIKKCLQIDKRKRYKDTLDLFNDFQHIKKLSIRYKHQAWMRDLKIGGVILLIALGTVLIFSGNHQLEIEKSESFEALCDEAEEALNESQDYPFVESLLAEADELYADTLEVHTLRAEALLKQKMYDECIDYVFDEYNVIAKDQGSKLNYIMGTAYFELEEYQDSVKYLENAYKLEPNLESYGRDYAVACGRSGDIETCGEVLDEIEDYGYDETVTYYVAGEYYRAIGDFNEAINAFENAQKSNLDEELAYKIIMSIAELYQENAMNMEDGYEKLISLLEEALREPQYMDNYIMTEMLGDAYCSYGHTKADKLEANALYSQSIKAFNRLLDAGISRKYIYNNLVLLYQEVEDFESAELTIDEMKTLYPEDYKVQLQLVWLYLLKEDPKEVDNRDYSSALMAFNQVATDYADYENDMEYQQLKNYMLELVDKNWIMQEDLKF